MTWMRFTARDGTPIVAHIHRQKPRRRKCQCCKAKPAGYQCDWITARPDDGSKKVTRCDKHLCMDCRQSVAPDKDLCPDHFLAYERWKAFRSTSRNTST